MTLPTHIAAAWAHCGLRVDGACLQREPGGRRYRRGACDSFRFWHVLRGRVSGDFGTGPLVAGPGCGLILPPGRAYLDQHDSDGVDDSVTMLIVLFQVMVPPGQANPLSRLRLPVAVAAADAAAAAGRCERIAALVPSWRIDWPRRIAVRPHLDELLSAHLADGFAAGAWDDGAPLPGWIADLRERAGRRITDAGLSAATLHTLAGRSREHVARALRRHLGTSAAGLLRRLRLELAARLLAQDGGMGIAEVAERVGYRDRSLFCRHFRTQLGTTPSRWRAQTRGAGHG